MMKNSTIGATIDRRVMRGQVAVAIAVFAIAALAHRSDAADQGTRTSSVPYVWKSVQMVGGGFVTGFILHPTAPDVRYARTDIGGAYRWNDAARQWDPLLDWVGYEDANLMGIESIAVDPFDPERVYLACGTYTNSSAPNGAILRSGDRGKTFQRTNMPFKMGGNENGRGNGERLAVNPRDGNVLYFGSRHAGLWKSGNRGASWQRVDSFPDVTETPSVGSGIVFVIFDPRDRHGHGAHSIVYVGVSLMGRDNLFRSVDDGRTWQPVPGQPRRYRPNHGALASDGMLYLSYGTDPGPRRMRDGGVWKLDTTSGRWVEITPEKPDPDGRAFGYGAVSVDSHDPQAAIASTFGRQEGEEIFRTSDGGKTWKPLFKSGGQYDFSLAPYVARTAIHWLLDIEIDPTDPDHAMFTTGYGGYETYNLTHADSGKATRWSVASKGIEETVALELVSPARGAHLISAIGDYGGFVHWNLDQPEPAGNYDNPHFENTSGIAIAALNPEVIVRVGRPSDHRGGGSIGYSLDGGRSWRPTHSLPTRTSTLGTVAVSADGASWVWIPERSNGYFTGDHGTTWTASAGLPVDARVVADPVNPGKFYGLALFDGKLLVSDDNGAHFLEQPLKLPGGPPRQRGHRGDARGGQDRLYATPGREGDLWLAAFDGLFHSSQTHSADAGRVFSRLPGVEEIHAFGFGKAAAGAQYPALYLVGTVHGTRGIFRSDNAASDWVRINDDEHQWGLVLHITGDPKRYGRVYVGTHGRGTMYGDPLRSAPR